MKSSRQITKNRYYFNDDNITDASSIRKHTQKITPKKVKQEPIDPEEIDDESADLSHVDLLSPHKAGTSRSRPTPVEVAQTVTFLKSKQGKTPTPAKQEKVRRNVEVAPPSKKVETPKVIRPSAGKNVRPEPKATSSSTPKGHQTPIGGKVVTSRAAAPKSAGKSESRSRERSGSPGKSDRYIQGSISSTRDVPKIKKERDMDLDYTIPIEENLRDEKVRMKKEKDKHSREKERKEFQRERDRPEEVDIDFGSTSVISKGRGRRRSLSDSFSENMIVMPVSGDATVDIKPTLDRKSAQEISLRLRNLLKLPKAHKWVCYEWFYSNVDKVLFDGENDFQICFRESFPQLKARKLTRVEWTKLRRLMGKPRRCSQSFFDEEREELARRRQKIRMIQQRKMTDFNYKELPDEIPLQLVIGTKVTTRLRRPQDGLFTGTIEGVDTSNNTYRITFDRPGLGTHSIPDYEVLSNESPETVSTSSFALKIPRRNYGAFSGGQFKFQTSSLADEMNGFPKSPFPVEGMLGGFPIRLLDMIVRLSKLLKAKREKLLQLKELNVEAEKMRSYGKTFNSDFRFRYAKCVLDLSSMNKEMAIYLDGVQQYCLEIAPEHGINQMIVPEHIKEHCDQEATIIIANCNNKQNKLPVQDSKAVTLITKLASMLLQVKTLSSGDRNLYEVKSIKDSLKDIKASLEGRNVQLFQDRIEIPMNRIQAGLTMPGNH